MALPTAKWSRPRGVQFFFEAAWALGLAATAVLANPGTVLAENELASLADGKFKPDLVSTECFATSCNLSTEKCIKDDGCKKGLMCTARCLGDSACITGCFARFGDEQLNNLLQCSIEDHKCINIAIMPPGNDLPEEAPEAPKALVSGVDALAMEGPWYKVLGWNRQYDCFDCQKNTFYPNQSPGTASLDVDFAMSSKKQGRGVERNDMHMHETVVFDNEEITTSSGRKMRSKRTAHTEGRMFGLTFWENWYVIGESKPGEVPFKFVYYTGKTLQNSYNGAFVYSKTPEIPRESMSAVYRVAREAGLDPTKFCKINNACFLEQSPQTVALTGAGALDDAQSTEVDVSRLTWKNFPWKVRVRALWYDFLDYAEDPNTAAKWMFDQQERMQWPDDLVVSTAAASGDADSRMEPRVQVETSSAP